MSQQDQQPGQRQVHVRLPSAMRQAVVERGERLGLTLNDVVRLALAGFLGWKSTQEKQGGQTHER